MELPPTSPSAANGLEFCAAFLAVSGLRACAMPINPAYTKVRARRGACAGRELPGRPSFAKALHSPRPPCRTRRLPTWSAPHACWSPPRATLPLRPRPRRRACPSSACTWRPHPRAAAACRPSRWRWRAGPRRTAPRPPPRPCPPTPLSCCSPVAPRGGPSRSPSHTVGACRCWRLRVRHPKLPPVQLRLRPGAWLPPNAAALIHACRQPGGRHPLLLSCVRAGAGRRVDVGHAGETPTHPPRAQRLPVSQLRAAARLQARRALAGRHTHAHDAAA